MATIQIKEGQTGTVDPADTLVFPGINSCLSITTVLPQITRLGGHSVLVPEGAQQTLQQICDFLNTRKYADKIFIIGDIGTWNQNWAHLPQCNHLRVNNTDVHNVAGIATALGYTPAKTILFDTTTGWGEGTYSIYFGFEKNSRSLWATNAAGKRCIVPGHPSW
jgi:hypothetical protein